MAADDRVVKVVLSAEVREYIKGMEEAAQKARETADETQKVRERAEALKTVGQYALAFGGAMSVAAGAVAKTGIEYNTLQQTSRAALSTLLGGAEAANAQMDKLDEFAKTSPFSKAVFIDAQQQLLGFGQEAERVVPTLDAIQNAVAATGGSNEDIAELVRIIAQLEGGVKISAETFNQFGTRGIDAAGLIGEAMGKTGQQIRDEVTAGTLDADMAIQALTDGMQERFGGAAANVKNTFDGAMDRVKAAWRDVAAELMTPLVDPNGGGFLIDAANGVADLIRQFQALPEPAKLTIAGIGGVTGAASLALGTFVMVAPKVVEFRKALEVLGPKAQFAGRMVGGLTKAAGGVAGVLALAHGLEAVADAAGQMGEKVRGAEDTLSFLLSGDVDSIFEGLGGAKDGINDLDSALEELLGGNWETKFNRWGSDTFAWTGLTSNVGKARDAFATIGTTLADLVNSGEADRAAELFKQITDEAVAQGYSVDDVTALMPAYQDALTGVANDQAIAADGTGDLADGLDGVASAGEKAAWSVDDLATAIRGFGSETLDTREAHRRFEEAVDKVTASVEENGASLDRSSEAGRANESALDALAQSTLDLAASTFELTGNEEDAARVIGDGRQALLDKLEAFGLTGEAASAYVDELGLIPENVDTLIALGGVEEANAALDEVARSRTAQVWVETYYNDVGTTPGHAIVPKENGDLIAYANGGFGKFRGPDIYAGGENVHKFAEPQTGWEAYISGKPEARERNIGVWQRAGERLGVTGAGSSSQQVTVNQSFNLPPGFTAGQIEAISGRGVQKALR